MHDISAPKPFLPMPPDAANVVTWVHLGDVHMTVSGQQNHLDLQAIVDEVNYAFARSVSFVFLPGDVADQGSAAQYEIVRAELDRLEVPWCSILGDHDVHEKSYANFLRFLSAEKTFSFTVGQVRFIALNAFDLPEPGSFTLLPGQLAWAEEQLSDAREQQQRSVVLLHCYPSDLKRGGDALHGLLMEYGVRLVEMGHTHYNEIANDGSVLYAATRSTGQIEEGPVGFSLTSIDGEVVSWKFVPLSRLPAVMITSPSDERFVVDPSRPGSTVEGALLVRAKAWSGSSVSRAVAKIKGHEIPMQRVAGSEVWRGELSQHGLADGVYDLTVIAEDGHGGTGEDTVRIVVGGSAFHPPARSPRDQDNAIEAWPERGLLGTQLGPNKNGKKW